MPWMWTVNWFGSRLPRTRMAGPRVYLRPPRRRDQRAWIDLRRVSQDFLKPYEPAWPRDALTAAGFRRRVKRVETEWQNQTGYGFFIFRKEDDSLIGGVTIANVRRGVVQAASVGYWIGEPFARQGYMFEALQLALDFCFGSLNLHRVEAACLIDNTASRHLLDKSGFRKEGVARQYLCIDGKWQDHVTYGILRSDPRPIVKRAETAA